MKSICVISYYANMPGLCQAEWVDDRITEFLKRGFKVILISSVCSERYYKPNVDHYRVASMSPAAFKFEFEEIERRQIGFSSRQLRLFRVQYSVMKSLHRFLVALKLNSGEGRWSWTFAAASQVIRNLKNIRNVDFIYTTGGPPSAHLAAILTKSLTGKRIMAELQDPLTGEDIGRNKYSKLGLAMMEKAIIKGADITLYVTENAKKTASAKYPSLAKKIDFVYPGANKFTKVLTKETNRDKVQILYLGSLYQTRNFDTLLSAIRKLVGESGETILNHFEVISYGGIHTKGIRERIENFEFPVVKLFPTVSREEVLQKAYAADILLLIQNTDNRSIVTIPFKTYDYLQIGKPILALIYRNDELEKMMLDHGHWVCQADDPEHLKNILKQIINPQGDFFHKAVRTSNLTPASAVNKMLALAGNL